MSDDVCTCGSCGYNWRRGENGEHTCVQILRKRIAELERSASGDPELDLLNRLATAFPDDLHKFVDESWVNLSFGYVDHPETVGSKRGNRAGFSWPGQSGLGFLNQSRLVRGLPRIVMVEEKTVPPTAPNVKWKVRFELLHEGAVA